jgi:hypothetical protein
MLYTKKRSRKTDLQIFAPTTWAEAMPPASLQLRTVSKVGQRMGGVQVDLSFLRYLICGLPRESDPAWLN